MLASPCDERVVGLSNTKYTQGKLYQDGEKARHEVCDEVYKILKHNGYYTQQQV